jgi:hypothetical protein
MVELLTTIEAGKWHVVTASNYCFNSYFRSTIVQISCAVIFCGCMETDDHFLMQFNATVMNYYFTEGSGSPHRKDLPQLRSLKKNQGL